MAKRRRSRKGKKRQQQRQQQSVETPQSNAPKKSAVAPSRASQTRATQSRVPQSRMGKAAKMSRLPVFAPIWQAQILDNRWLTIAAIGVIYAMVAVALYPATQAGFVWDDAAFTLVEPVQKWSGIWKIWFEPATLIHEGHYWPFLYSTFWLEHKLWGYNPLPFHILNLILHATISVLLWRLLRRFGIAGAWVAAAVFAVHPLHVESATWVIGRKDLLATLFYIGSVFCYITYVETQQRSRYVCSVALFLLGLLCKYIGVTLPASLLVWHWWKKGRITLADFIHMLPYLALGLTITIVDYLWYASKEIINFDFTVGERILLAAKSLGFYLSKLVLPIDLAIIYTRWEVRPDDLIAWGCLVGGIIGLLLLWQARDRIGRGALAGVLFFIITLSPTLGFIDYGYMQFAFVADRYQYLASAGVIVVAVASLTYAFRWVASIGRAGMRIGVQIFVTLFMLALLSGYGTLSWRHASVYRNDGTLFEHIISLNDYAREAYHSVGAWYQSQGRIQDALDAYRIADERRPDHAPLLNRIGMVLDTLNQPTESEKYYRLALKRRPEYEHSLHNLALLLAKQKRYQEVIALCDTLLRVNPKHVHGHVTLGVALFGLNRPEEALRSFDRALAIDPNLEAAKANRDHVLQSLQSKKVQN